MEMIKGSIKRDFNLEFSNRCLYPRPSTGQVSKKQADGAWYVTKFKTLKVD